ncbi:MAG TPA: glycosyltransferase family 9 protein [Chloroflexota bacterium]|nr:glycosyltransferase family 9 protein [Chloroflexota bacterium]
MSGGVVPAQGTDEARLRWRRRVLGALAWPFGGPAARPGDGTVRWPSGRRPRLLVVRPDHLGDLLLATPALGLLRAALPEAEITALVGPWARPVLDGRPEVDAVRTCAFPGFTRAPAASPLAPYAKLLAEAARLRARRYDAALVLRVDHWWGAALVAYAGVPLRLGYAVPESRPFLTHALPPDFAQHSVLESWRVAAELLALVGRPLPAGPPPAVRAEPPSAGQAMAAAWLAERGIGPETPLIAVQPGSGVALKQWPPERWGEVADALAARLGARVVVTGTDAERALVDAVVAATRRPALNAAGAFDWAGLAGLFARCALVLGVDSGALHLAAALGVPSVHLFGPTAPTRFGPWGGSARHQVVRVDLPCSPCGNLIAPPCGEQVEPACMRALLPAMAIRAGLEAVAGGAPAAVEAGCGRGGAPA